MLENQLCCSFTPLSMFLLPLATTLSILPLFPFPFPHLHTTPDPSFLCSSPNLRLTPLPLREVDGAYLCSGKHSFAATAPLSSIQSFYSSSAVLLTSPHTSPFSSSFQFPLLKWDVVYRGECVHSLSPAPVWVLGGGNGPVMKQRVLLCKHTPTKLVGFLLCVYVFMYMCVHTRTFEQVVD